jgi:KaiC
METQSPHASVTKMPTGIEGFDEITGGGLPRGRTTLVVGSDFKLLKNDRAVRRKRRHAGEEIGVAKRAAARNVPAKNGVRSLV